MGFRWKMSYAYAAFPLGRSGFLSAYYISYQGRFVASEREILRFDAKKQGPGQLSRTLSYSACQRS
ncbi:hypothetical protein BACCAP_01397 [Pseudoflavonifractor capillosus ATCC 29799]|uniref:Uncharacterized protein n=1 Tax=Pseudoflavonifractor capillosus ATCC 29799 TaxID=411467 RepID=A6NT69_9FIRM|nr:hypothetical protein BACCAP_01397 [Pseudoflavonifractor capillosus ATCC 29799]